MSDSPATVREAAAFYAPRSTPARIPSPVFAPAVQPAYDLRYIALLLGRSYSSAQLLEADAVLTHVKYHGAAGLNGLTWADIRFMRQAVQHTRLIDALNRNRKWARRRLAERLAPLLTEGNALAVVPSHDPWTADTPLRALSQDLATLTGNTDATGCLVRHTKIKRIVFGGPSNKPLHRQTIALADTDLLTGQHVLLLDDIAKSGQSLLACRALLQEAGAASVQAAALGRVIGGPLTSVPPAAPPG